MCARRSEWHDVARLMWQAIQPACLNRARAIRALSATAAPGRCRRHPGWWRPNAQSAPLPCFPRQPTWLVASPAESRDFRPEPLLAPKRRDRTALLYSEPQLRLLSRPALRQRATPLAPARPQNRASFAASLDLRIPRQPPPTGTGNQADPCDECTLPAMEQKQFGPKDGNVATYLQRGRRYLPICGKEGSENSLDSRDACS